MADFLQKVPIPTLDRPFGVHLWPIFDKAYEQVMGYPASEFNFVAGSTPLSTFKETATMLVTYYIIIFGGREVMKNFPAFKLNTLFMIHNFLLTAISAILLALFVEQLLPTIVRHGVFYSICDHRGGWTQPLIILYYVSVASRCAKRSKNWRD
jgi:fatty acid elongase 3